MILFYVCNYFLSAMTKVYEHIRVNSIGYVKQINNNDIVCV